MQSKAKTVAQYLKELVPERRAAISAVRDVILKNIDPGFQEGMQYGMIGYFVPHETYPDGYHCDPKQPLPFAALASQKNYMSLYAYSIYSNPADMAWLVNEAAARGRRLDMGKCCIRFKRVDDLPLDVIGKLFKRTSLAGYVSYYEKAMAENLKSRKKSASQKPATDKSTTAKAAGSVKAKVAQSPKAKAVKKPGVGAASRTTSPKVAKRQSATKKS